MWLGSHLRFDIARVDLTRNLFCGHTNTLVSCVCMLVRSMPAVTETLLRHSEEARMVGASNSSQSHCRREVVKSFDMCHGIEQ